MARATPPTGLAVLLLSSSSMRADANTPAETDRCLCRSLPDHRRPSPKQRRVGFCIMCFEACSAFTRVPARMVAEPPRAALCRQSASVHFVTSVNRPGCYQPERQLLGGVRTRQKKAPFHGARCLSHYSGGYFPGYFGRAEAVVTGNRRFPICGNANCTYGGLAVAAPRSTQLVKPTAVERRVDAWMGDRSTAALGLYTNRWLISRRRNHRFLNEHLVGDLVPLNRGPS